MERTAVNVGAIVSQGERATRKEEDSGCQDAKRARQRGNNARSRNTSKEGRHRSTPLAGVTTHGKLRSSKRSHAYRGNVPTSSLPTRTRTRIEIWWICTEHRVGWHAKLKYTHLFKNLAIVDSEYTTARYTSVRVFPS